MMKYMKRKVLVGITKSNFGGAQRYVFDLARSLVARGFDVAIVCGASGTLVDKLNTSGIRVITLPKLKRDVSVFGDIRVFFSLIKILREEKPDILHLNSSKMSGIGALAGQIMRIPHIVFTAHGWEFNAPRPQWQRWIIRFFSTLIVLLADRTIAVSSAIKRDLCVMQNKIHVIHNGIETPVFLDKEAARDTIIEHSKTPIDAAGFWFVTIAELHPVKGLDIAIDAFSKAARSIPDAHYVIIGEGQERVSLTGYIHAHGLDGRVHLVGFIPDAVRYLKATDVFILPSRSEGLGYVILEAGMASLPVVASNVGGIPEIITSGVDGILVAPDNVHKLANIMTILAHDERMRNDLGHTLHKRVLDHFSLARMIADTIAVYE